MAHERIPQPAGGNPRFTLGGATFELLAGPEGHPDGSAVVLMTMPPDQGRFMAPDYRHPTREGVEVVSGRAGITDGYDDARVAVELGPGGQVQLGADEWHAIRNLSAAEDLVTRLTHTPGEKWAKMLREGAQLERTGGISNEFMIRVMEETGTEFARPGQG